ncbi:hypothetical protein ACFL6F_01815 [Planctomycetota bacterium]
MTTYTQIEKRYKTISLWAGVILSVFWVVMIVFLVYERVREYRKESAIDYSILFKAERIRSFSYMDIYLEDKLLGFTKTNISETEDGGRTINGETMLDLSVIPTGFSMTSVIRISPKQEFEYFTFSIKSPFEAELKGKREGKKLVIECKAMNYREEMDLPQGLVSAGISPFSDVVSLKKGREWQVGTFDPVTRTMKKVKIKVVSEKKITWLEREESVFVLECTDMRGNNLATALVDSYGNILRETIHVFGMTLRFEKRD